MSQGFEFPKIHSFPPLYTKQPNTTILQSQLDSWCDIVLRYCEHYKILTLSISGEPIHSQNEKLDLKSLPSLFINTSINRTVEDRFREMIFKHLIHKLNKADYINPKRPELGIIVLWRSLVDWSNLLYEHIENTGQLGSVLTLYELTKSEDSSLPDSLHNIEQNLLIKIIKDVLVKLGKAQILMDENNEIGGVKIV